MRTKIFNKRTVRERIAALCALCVLTLPGCAGQPSETIPVQSMEKSTFITCFGTVMWRESQPLIFPFDVHIQSIEARDGQVASAQDVLFYIDSHELVSRKAVLVNAVEALQFMKSGYENELEQLQGVLAFCQRAAEEFNSREIMDILASIAKNRYKPSQFTQDRLALTESLSRYGILNYYNELLAYATARDEFYYKDANPLLAQIEQSFSGKLLEYQAQTAVKSAQIRQAESELQFARKRADTITAFLSGGTYQDVKIAENGAVTIADDGFLLDNINISPNTIARADEPVLSMVNMDSLEVICYVEEQLVKNIKAGDKAQMALYSDSTVIELGTVAFVSQKAILRDGETVVEVVIAYEGDSFLPGYNVVAKITPAKAD